jgi:hypothetical protein
LPTETTRPDQRFAVGTLASDAVIPATGATHDRKGRPSLIPAFGQMAMSRRYDGRPLAQPQISIGILRLCLTN